MGPAFFIIYVYLLKFKNNPGPTSHFQSIQLWRKRHATRRDFKSNRSLWTLLFPADSLFLFCYLSLSFSRCPHCSSITIYLSLSVSGVSGRQSDRTASSRWACELGLLKSVVSLTRFLPAALWNLLFVARYRTSFPSTPFGLQSKRSRQVGLPYRFAFWIRRWNAL